MPRAPCLREQPSALLEAAGCGCSGSGLGAGREDLRALGGDAALRRGKLDRGRWPALARPQAARALAGSRRGRARAEAGVGAGYSTRRHRVWGGLEMPLKSEFAVKSSFPERPLG